jgi:hypothetical protein
MISAVPYSQNTAEWEMTNFDPKIVDFLVQFMILRSTVVNEKGNVNIGGGVQ